MDLGTIPRMDPAVSNGCHALRRGPAALLILACLVALPSCEAPPRADGRREEKSVLEGELLAIFPGFFVHGMGHRYAGNKERADDLLLMEGYSVLTAGLGGGLAALGNSQDWDAVEVAGWVGVGVGGIGFLGSWIYDIALTPSEIRRANREGGKGE
jgi:hypothetical protein